MQSIKLLLLLFFIISSNNTYALTFSASNTCVNSSHTFISAGTTITTRAACFTGAYGGGVQTTATCRQKCTNGDWYTGSNSAVNTSCPTNSTLSSGSCSPNTGYSAVNDGSGNWTVKATGTECTSDKIYNELNGLCIEPPGDDCNEKKNTVIIEPFQAATGCTSSDCKFTDGSAVKTNPPSFICIRGCQYDRSLNSIHECYAVPPFPTNAYCTADFKAGGQTCPTPYTVSTSKPSTAVNTSTTAYQVEDFQASSSSNPQNSNSSPSLGGSGTNNTSSPSQPTSPSSPTGGTQQTVTSGGSTDGCVGCATESTQVQVLNAVTNVGSGVPQPAFETTTTSDDLTSLLVSNDAIQGMFRFSMPPHVSTCPTLSLEVPYFGWSGTMTSHCTIIEPYYSQLRQISLIAWVVLAITIILGA